MNRTLAVVLTAAALVWASILIGAPIALQSRIASPSLALLYVGASRICHQKPERTFHLGGQPLPVCARCTGIYLAAAVGTAAAWIGRRRRPAMSPRTVLALAAAPTVVTWILEHVAGVPFSNLSRALAALPLGGVAGWLFVSMLRYDSRLDAQQVLHS